MAFLCVLIATTSYGTNVTISGPTQVCPNQSYTWTASASNSLGSWPGEFQWSLWRNGVSLGQFSGGIHCDNTNNSSNSSATFTMDDVLGPIRIKVQYRGNYMGCISSEEFWYDVNIRVFNPGPISGLLFCSGGQTQTVSIPGIDNVAASCFYHYKYDWIVPAGWTITTNVDFYEVIPGGIRTFARSVQITAPATMLPGFSGNYNVTVSTEPAWPWPQQTTAKIWVGNPSISASPSSGPGEPTTVLFTAPLVNGATYDWYSGPTTLRQSGSSNTFDTYFPCNQTRSTLCKMTAGSCVALTSNSISVTGGCDRTRTASTFALSPNPSNNRVTISAIQEDGSTESLTANEIDEVRIIDMQLHSKVNRSFNKTQSATIDLQELNLSPGIYIVEILSNGRSEKHRLEITKQ